MTDYRAFGSDEQHSGSLVSAVPPDFVPITERLHPWIDRKLGYFGTARFVIFRYEPRADGVMWKDGCSYGFGSGAWWVFMDHIAPLMDLYEVNLGSSEAEGRHALVIDRVQRAAYFAERERAERFLTYQ